MRPAEFGSDMCSSAPGGLVVMAGSERSPRVFSGCGGDRCQGVRCSTRCFVLQRLVGSVAERFRSGAAPAAKEDRGLVGEVVVVSVGVDDSGGSLAISRVGCSPVPTPRRSILTRHSAVISAGARRNSTHTRGTSCRSGTRGTRRRVGASARSCSRTSTVSGRASSETPLTRSR